MTRLLAMSFDAPTSPRITLRWQSKHAGGSSSHLGWGIAWYPPDELGAIVVKDPTSHGDDAMTALLRAWPRFRSTIFVGHLRGAARRVAQEDTHPFSRGYAGCDWVLAHNGWLGEGFREALPLDPARLHEPVGHTDSEYVLCWLLDRAHEAGARRLADVGWERLRDWLGQVNAQGTCNLVLSDGLDVAVYQDKDLYNPLQRVRRTPPHVEEALANEDIELAFTDARDDNRSGIIVTTTALSGGGWTPFEAGQLLVLRRGSVTWDSAATSRGVKGPERAVPPVADGSAAPARQQTAMSPTGAASELRTYRVHHESVYVYEEPIERSTHILRLRPVGDRLQELIEHELVVEPLARPNHYEDVFGNEVATFDLDQPYQTLRVVTTSLVRLRLDPRRTLHSPVRRSSIPLVWMPWQRQMMSPYLLPHELPETQLRELFDYAMGFVERQDYDLTECLLDINRTIYADFAYVQGSTTVETTPFEVYSTRRGVCQDFANLLICMARLLGVPARYRVGYIHTSKDYENTLQSDASHAWAELYLPWFGWQGFDPTNGCLAGLDHVRVACGRNYRDATPTSGTIYRGGGTETLTIDVRVELQNGGGSGNELQRLASP